MARTTTRRSTYGQHFLHERRLIRHLVELADIEEHDLVVEIGPGDGALTTELLRRSRLVLAVELDGALVERLQARFAGEPGLVLFPGDFLDFPLPRTPHKVFANIPYRHTASMVGKLTSGSAPPEDMFLVMQREAAQRFRGEPMGTLLATQLAPWFDVSIAHAFRRTDFLPAPAVESVMLRIHRREEELVPRDQRDHYLDLASALYSAWQPTVSAALRKFFSARTCRAIHRELEAKIEVRPSAVSMEAWTGLQLACHQWATPRDWQALAAARNRLQEQQEILERPTRTRRRSARR